MAIRALTAVLFVVAAGALTAADSPEHPSLVTLLERLDRTAGLYRSGALDFTCVERVDYKRRRDKYHYIYKVTDGVLEDHHVPLALGKSKEPLERPTHVPDGIGRPSLWTSVFAQVRQPYNQYRVIGREVVLGRSTVLISFEPMPGQPVIDEVNDWIGTAWVDEETFQLVKVAAFAARSRANYLDLLDKYEALERRAKMDPQHEAPKPFVFKMTTYSTLFGQVKNGMRFPTESRTEQREYLVPGEDIDDPSAGRRKFLVLQTFTKYQFFSVRTEEQVTQIVLGQAPPD